MEIGRKAMNPLYGLMLFGVAFFGLMVVVGVVQARRKKERAYYISAIVAFLMLLSSIFVMLNQFILVLVLFVAIGILSIAGLPRILKATRREPLKELQETYLSASLRVRDLLTWKAWFKLTSRLGVRRTMCYYALIMTGGCGAILFTFSILDVISIAWAIGYTIFVGIASPIFFHLQVRKALEKHSSEHQKRL
jgi:Na+/melibiose symporter-like transporter